MPKTRRRKTKRKPPRPASKGFRERGADEQLAALEYTLAAHLKQAIREGRLIRGRHRVGDWLALLDAGQFRRLQDLADEFDRQTDDAGEFVVLTVMLNDLEGNRTWVDELELLDLGAHFLTIISIEWLKRQGFIETDTVASLRNRNLKPDFKLPPYLADLPPEELDRLGLLFDFLPTK